MSFEGIGWERVIDGFFRRGWLLKVRLKGFGNISLLGRFGGVGRLGV